MPRTLLLLAALLATHPNDGIRSAGAEAWRPRPRPVRSEWCTANIWLPARTSAQPGRFELSDHAYLAEIIDAVDDPDVREIVFVAVPQTGKTTLLEALILSQGEVDAAPMMFATSTEDDCKEKRALIYELAEASPAIRDRVPPKQLRNDRAIDLVTCLVHLAWSGSSQRLSGKPCKKVLCSEVDRWERTVDLAVQRTKAFLASSTAVFEGSPVGTKSTLWGLYLASDRRKFKVPCPHCGHFQELRFFPHRDGPYRGCGGVVGIKVEEGPNQDVRYLSPEEGRKAAYYLCEKGCRIDEDDRREMVRRGIWVPEGCHVEIETKKKRTGSQDKGDKKARNPRHPVIPSTTSHVKVAGKPTYPGRRRGYQLNALYSPATTFGDAAETWLRKRDELGGLEAFWNDFLGMPFRPRGKTPRWEELGRRLAGATPRGHVPPWAYFLTGAADVQEDRVYWTVRAWGDGCTSALVDVGVLKKPAGDEGEEFGGDLAQLDALFTRRWPVMGGKNPLGFDALAVCRFGIDSGYRPNEVYAFVRRYPGERIVAVAGDPAIMPGLLYRKRQLERNVRTGKFYPEGTFRWAIDTSSYKSELQARWAMDRRGAGVWWLPSDMLGTPGGEDFLRQITNQREVSEVKNGRKRTRFEPISEQTGDHYLDTSVYERALADQVTGREWDAATWPWVTRAEAPEPVETFPPPREAGTDFAAR
ncbi:MAG TPA: terminase gpA endonuclease subunit [Phycisphaerae bacterium]|nr:terminase gpA endonuclease subunit [Phycisphaerae bacterium]